MADLEEHEVTSGQRYAHPGNLASAAEAMQLLGNFDGGGVTALAFKAGVVASGGHDGIVKVWRHGGSELHFQDTLETGSVAGAICLLAEGSRIWVASLGRDLELLGPRHGGREGRQLLSHGAGWKALLLRLDSGEALALWRVHTDGQSRAITIAHGCVLSGGSDGSIQRRFLPGTDFWGDPSTFDAVTHTDELAPRHGGPVVALCPRAHGILISGGA